MQDLNSQAIPNVPQRATINALALRLWQRSDVLALWLGGSLACGTGDKYSDIDFRVAVSPEQFAAWKTPDFASFFAHAPVLGQQCMVFGNAALLHHLVLANGEIVDFFVQSAEHALTAEVRLILGCRDAALASRLADMRSEERSEELPVSQETLQQLLISFWISTHKHRKVLYRGLDLLALQGIQGERAILLRLMYIAAKGRDYGDMHRQTIHSLTDIIRTVQTLDTEQAQALLGAPMRDRQEVYQVIEQQRATVSRVGRQLTQTYGVSYPTALEAVVLKDWQDFKHEQGAHLI
ncbi:hypothetical protein EPA93_02850 [Ktedonosporobacter rubrisoli]|uniref:Nucleotidyltransferase domain-containing protein n=1 Tax=Ktedonosporobacter rubrisoli TaxID=2509675 RepID=A0A4P6JIR9_KTERU|nr:hypothetical protein [Ktedonosporobacter rubrisoli]QBD74987.1 hypothetical protein EPA93_02850 [Ktedonosporobacter rubrisoli]